MCAVSSGIFCDLTARYALDWKAAHWAARVVAQTPNASVPVRGLRARVPIDRMLAFTAALKAGQPAGTLVPNIGAA